VLSPVLLATLDSTMPDVYIRALEVSQNDDNLELYRSVMERLGVDALGVPALVVGDAVIVGYGSDATTGVEIKSALMGCRATGCDDVVQQMLDGTYSDANSESSNAVIIPEKIDVPLVGPVVLSSLSLPLLTVVIAAIDGFNPCAMWVLLFLIALLLNMQSKRKMWVLGSAFIIISGVVYFVFLAAWLNLFRLLETVGFRQLTLIVGVIALGSATWQLRSWWRNRDGSCHATNEEQRKRIIRRLRKITEGKSFWLALAGIISLAFVVNLIELVCSAGLPAIYTKVLDLTPLSPAAYYSYLLLYVVVFIMDDLAVFIIAMVTLRAFAISSKYSRYSARIGGILIGILGIILLSNPGLLMFG